jgi:hypothetical protein
VILPTPRPLAMRDRPEPAGLQSVPR